MKDKTEKKKSKHLVKIAKRIIPKSKESNLFEGSEVDNCGKAYDNGVEFGKQEQKKEINKKIDKKIKNWEKLRREVKDNKFSAMKINCIIADLNLLKQLEGVKRK